MGIQRPGDQYWLDVAYDDGSVKPFAIDSQDDTDAIYEINYVLGSHHTYAAAKPVSGILYRASGEVVAEVSA